MNLITIAKGWTKYLQASSQTRELMIKRLKVCDNCPFKEQVSPGGQIIMRILNSPENLFRCGKCHCPLGALASVTTPGCKEGKWNNIK